MIFRTSVNCGEYKHLLYSRQPPALQGPELFFFEPEDLELATHGHGAGTLVFSAVYVEAWPKPKNLPKVHAPPTRKAQHPHPSKPVRAWQQNCECRKRDRIPS